MKSTFTIAIFLSCWLLCPGIVFGQGYTEDVRGLNSILADLYKEMFPLCSKLVTTGRAIAGFAALFYIGNRVWRHIANAEPVDFYPLLRPFALGFAIAIFPSVISLINGVLSLTVQGTSNMVTDSDKAISTLLKMKEDAVKNSDFWQMYVGDDNQGSREKWLKYTYGDGYSEDFTDGLGNDIKFYMSKQYYTFKNTMKAGISEILTLIFESASLCINTIRTFYLIVLAIIGPLAFGLAVFDGLQHTLSAWISRYINIYLWLPVANIFGAIIGRVQQKMIELDIRQISQAGDTFFSANDASYLIFLIIGIMGYFSVPSLANHIISAGGSDSLLGRATSAFNKTATGLLS
ncbi:conjugative transposon protein TraJ [Dyadobacter psychrotolerans]|uniref:Conjugative transposon protein TraJ n=1 Tax=Dyadobacter psychrotolerans TaxID=2541721 RepID=A0A4R5DAQ1_9BACT|nr:conjugative transposon protein TraJ [Dyadobacter psychrotolerans]TDE10726.1 conjugative transposon protein TraJ [Dyadobacter psychrotolerans]